MKTTKARKRKRAAAVACTDLLGTSIDAHFIDWFFELRPSIGDMRMILAVKRFEGFGADFPLHRELAEYIGTGRAWITRSINRPVRRGILRKERATKLTHRYEVCVPNARGQARRESPKA